jgi:hypothetical protein
MAKKYPFGEKLEMKKNTEHRTLNVERDASGRSLGVRRSMFNVRCFSFRWQSIWPTDDFSAFLRAP